MVEFREKKEIRGGGVRRLGFQTLGWDFWDVTNLPHKGISPSRFRLDLRKDKGIPSSRSRHSPR
jgi:hypothetical protein